MRFRPFLVFAAVWVLGVVLLLGACIPTRDNPSDPTFAPTAVLTWTAGPWNRQSAACGVPDEIKPAVESRGRCLHLDASASALHDDSVPTRFQYSIVRDGMTLEQTPVVSSSSWDFDPTVLGKYDAGVGVRTFRVEVSDSSGHLAGAEISLSFTNDSPIARTPGQRIVPIFGNYWSAPRSAFAPLGDPIRVELTARDSVDPDGDILAYCWHVEREGANDPCNQPADPLSPPLPAGWSLVESTAELVGGSSSSFVGAYKLTLTDGLERAQGFVSIHAAANVPLWARDQATHDALRIDPRRDHVVAPATLYPRVLPSFGFGASTTTTVVWYVESSNGSASGIRHSYVAGQDYYGPGTDPRVPLPVALRSVNAIREDGLYDTAYPGGPGNQFRRNLWVAGVAASSPNIVICLLNDGTLALKAPCFDTGRPLPNAGDTPILDIGKDGTLWYATAFGAYAFAIQFDPNGGTLSSRVNDAGGNGLVADPGFFITGIAIRKIQGASEPTETWVIESQDIFSDPSTAGVAEARVFGDDHVEIRQIPLAFGPVGKSPPYAAGDLTGFPLVSQPRFTTGGSGGGEDILWVNALGVGIATADVLPSGDMRLRTINTDVGLALETTVDFSGDLLLLGDGNHRLLHASLDGSVNQVDTASEIDGVVSAGPIDTYWTVENLQSVPEFVLNHGSGQDGVLMRQQVDIGLTDGAVDYASGDFWFPTLLPSSLERLYADGKVADQVLGVTNPATGSTAHFGAVGLVASDPESGAIWVGDGASPGNGGVSNRLWRFDPYAPRTNPGYAAADFGGLVSIATTALQAAVQPIAESGTSALHPLVFLQRQSAPDATCSSPLAGGEVSFSLRRIHTDGTVEAGKCVQQKVPINPNNGRPDAPILSRDLYDGSVCIAFRANGGGTTTLRHYDAALTNFSEVSLPYGDFRSVAAVLDTCWVGFRDYSSGNNGVFVARFDQAAILLVGSTPAPAQPPATVTLIDPGIHGINWMTPITEARPVSGAIYNAIQQEMLIGGDDGRVTRIGMGADNSSYPPVYGQAILIRDQLVLPFRTSLIQP